MRLMAAVLVIYPFLRLAEHPPAQAVGNFWPDRLAIVVTFATVARRAGRRPPDLRDIHWRTARV
jgi:hypothetical protein